MAWRFYGRSEPLAELRRIIAAGRWFFCRIEGRRRIGKTSLLRQVAFADDALGARIVYCQIPDSDERDVAVAFQRALAGSDSPAAREHAAGVTDFPSMAHAIGAICRAGCIVVLDEFQYFTRAALKPFASHLQAEVDALRAANLEGGGLIVLGSLQSEMTAMLEDQGAPLFGRITHRLHLDHWDFADLVEMYRDQGLEDPTQWLTLWTFFEGVPKFYNDAYEQNLYSVAAANFSRELMLRMFLRGSSPLAEEADTWFLRELRGRAISVLHYLADYPGCAHGDLVSALTDPAERQPVASFLKTLIERYGMVERRNPVFSDSRNRNARYYIADNFLQAWLAVAKPAREAARMKPLERLLPQALRRLETTEGHAFERLIQRLHVEASRRGVGDFELSSIQLGYWNRPRDTARSIEIDLVALDEPARIVRFGSCKRSAAAHEGAALAVFDGHIAAFLASRDHRNLAGWTIEKRVFAPRFTAAERRWLAGRGFTSVDLVDYATLLERGN